jgi:hypothetical protein
MGLNTAQRAVVAVLIGFAIPLIGWAVPGERGPDTLTGALLQGVVITIAIFLLRTLRYKTRSSALEAGQELRERRGRDDGDARGHHVAGGERPDHETSGERRGNGSSTD